MPSISLDILEYGIPGVFSLLLGILFLYFRLKSADNTITQVQGWGMVLLAWLFICNGVLDITGIFYENAHTITLTNLIYDLPVIAPTFLLGFALVFPIPIVRPSRLPWLFLILSITLAIVEFDELGNNAPFNLELPYLQDWWIYVGWFGSLFRWVQVYRHSAPHPQVSLITSILIWGVLYHVVVNILLRKIISIPMAAIPSFLVVGLGVLQFLILTVIFLICHQLYERWGKWRSAEKLHVFMFLFTIVIFGMAYLFSYLGIIYLSWIFVFMVSNGGILIVRPTLICYAILRYQFFGHEVKAERMMIFFATLMISYHLAMFFTFGILDPKFTMGGVGVPVAFLVFLYPSYLLAKRLVALALPGMSKMTKKQARDIYLVSLQGAAFKGVVEDRRDARALKEVRARLHISDREHNLLLENERLRVRGSGPVNKISHAIFVKDTGQLVASVGLLDDQDEIILAGMLTAVRMFVKDAFGASTGDLDTIQYGKFKLLMEWEKGYILTLKLEGETDPSSRTIVGDLLAVIMYRHQRLLVDWDGDKSVVKVIQEDIEKLVLKYNKTGAF